MLNDEERKAIEELKKVRWNSLAVVVKNEDGKMDISYFTEKHKKTLLNLIEKQSKEIEELNKENTRQHELIGNIHQKWEDKVKAKIEELEKIIEFEKPTYEDVLKYAIEVLQSLLEKE